MGAPIDNINYQSPLTFSLMLNRTPTVGFYGQTVTVPGIALPPTELPTPFVTIPLIGNNIRFKPLEITFKVDSTLTNYLEIFNWMIQIGAPNNFAEAATVGASTARGQMNLELANMGRYSDGILTINDSQRNPKFRVKYKNMTPIGLSDLVFDTTKTDVEYLTCTATFAYQSHVINTL